MLSLQRKILSRLVSVVLLLLVTIFLACHNHAVEPHPLQPGQGSNVELPVRFVWSSIAGADSFVLEADTSDAFVQPLIDTTWADTEITVLRGMPPGRWYWRVAACDRSGGSLQFSSTVSFKVTGWSYPKRLAATVTVSSRPSGLAVTPDGREVWVGCLDSTDRSLYVVSSSDLTVTHRVASEGFNHAKLVFDPSGSHAYCCATVTPEEYSEVEEFSTSTYERTDSYCVSCGGGCHSWPAGYGICASYGGDFVLAVDASEGIVCMFATGSGGRDAQWDVDGPFDVALDRRYARAYVTCLTSQLVELDANTLDSVNALDIGARVGLVLTAADGRYAYVGHVSPAGFSVVDLSDLSLVRTVKVPGESLGTAPFALAVSPDQQYLFLGTADSSYVLVVDISEPERARFVDHFRLPGTGVRSIAFAPDGFRAYATVEPTGIVVLEK